VTTPQAAAAEVAERSGSIALQTNQGLVGVVENMAWLEQEDGTRLEIFGSGGGQSVSDSLSKLTGTDVPLLGQIPLDINLREAGDDGVPVVLSAPDSPAARALSDVALSLTQRERGLSGMRLNISPV
jgi:ATP-binding protein involved in chromosome partitioning